MRCSARWRLYRELAMIANRIGAVLLVIYLVVIIVAGLRGWLWV